MTLSSIKVDLYMGKYTNVFPDKIKKSVLLLTERVLKEYSPEEEKENLLKNTYHFIDSDEDLVKEIIKFANLKEVKPFVIQNIKFCYPTTFPIAGEIISHRFSLGGAGADVIELFNDFIINTARLVISSKDKTQRILDEWEKFENEFFADEIKVNFTTLIASFYYHAGGIIEDLIPRDDVTIRYLHPDTDSEKSLYHMLKTSLENSFRPTCVEEFNTVPIIMEYKKVIKKSENIEIHFRDVASLFEKVTFLLRIIAGGSVHFGFIKPIFLGNHGADNHIFQNYQQNHLFANSPTSTTLDNGPYETWIKRVWVGIEKRDVAEWQFANQKLRDSYSRISKNDKNYFFDSGYQLARHLERLVDLIQAFENTIGDYGRFISEYVAKLVARGDTTREAELQDKIQALYILRDKYLHGKPTGRDSVNSTFQSKFQGKIDLLEKDINALEYYLKQVLLISIMNIDIKEKLAEYHKSLGRPIVSVQRVPANPIDFPTFNTIYY